QGVRRQPFPIIHQPTNPLPLRMNTINSSIHKSTNPATPVRLFASSRSWIEGEAVCQLYACSKLKGVRMAIGFPDLHPAKGTLVGAVFVTEGFIYPHLIGRDIGCGMALFETDLVRQDVKLDQWAQIPFDIEHVWTHESAEVLDREQLESTEFD